MRWNYQSQLRAAESRMRWTAKQRKEWAELQRRKAFLFGLSYGIIGTMAVLGILYVTTS